MSALKKQKSSTPIEQEVFTKVSGNELIIENSDIFYNVCPEENSKNQKYESDNLNL